MKIRMKTTAVGPGVDLQIGHVYDLPDERAMELFEGGYCEIVTEPKKETIAEPIIVETAVKEERETALSPRGRRKKI